MIFFVDIQAHGIPPDEFAFTAIINGYKRAKPVGDRRKQYC